MALKWIRKHVGLIVPYSLKYRLMILLVLSTVIPLALIGSISYLSLHSIQENKVRSGIQNSLNQLGMELTNSMNNLNYASQQLAFVGGDVVDDLQALQASSDAYTTFYLTKKITDEMSLIDYTNIQLGLMFYYTPGSGTQISFENLNVKPDFSIATLPAISKQMNVTYFGPHVTLNRYSGNMVFSVLRRVNIPDRNMYIYIETNYKLFDDMLKTTQYGMHVVHFLTNDAGSIIFSENPASIPVGSAYGGSASLSTGDGRTYYVFNGTGEANYGWHLNAAVDRTDFNHENYDWIVQFVAFSILSVALSVFFALFIWRTIYKPIRVFNREIQYIEDSKFDSPLKKSRNKEFDQLFVRFRQMATKISELIRDVEQKERAKRYLEAEKLRYKINPHFLHNTLDTVRWLARINGQEDIDRLVSSLNKVLHYNLGKMGEITTIGEEIEVLEEYVTVQKMKYDFDFSVSIDSDRSALAVPAPRFILQPLVENALQHGLKDNLEIRVEVSMASDGSFATIRVSDNGEGMTEQRRRQLLDEASGRDAGLGIGVDYVKSMLEAHYGQEARLDITSEPGQGTVVTIMLPASGAVDKPAPGVDGGKSAGLAGEGNGGCDQGADRR